MQQTHLITATPPKQMKAQWQLLETEFSVTCLLTSEYRLWLSCVGRLKTPVLCSASRQPSFQEIYNDFFATKPRAFHRLAWKALNNKTCCTWSMSMYLSVSVVTKFGSAWGSMFTLADMSGWWNLCHEGTNNQQLTSVRQLLWSGTE